MVSKFSEDESRKKYCANVAEFAASFGDVAMLKFLFEESGGDKNVMSFSVRKGAAFKPSDHSSVLESKREALKYVNGLVVAASADGAPGLSPKPDHSVTQVEPAAGIVKLG